MPSGSACRVDTMLKVIGDRWTLGIIHELSIGPRRTLEILGAFTGLSTKTLADRLKKLDRGGIIRRTSYPESPPRVEYSLTAKGRDLLPVVEAIWEAAGAWATDVSATECRVCATHPDGRTKPDRQQRGQPGKSNRKPTDVTLL
ncbi:MAG TPA: helix-turn-helix domain-containing protein [Blastocatellia bacterium]|nr:helix-turn-helix domain-containing protein [Blastocatellia bacterium]